MYAIETIDLTKRYGTKEVLRGVGLRVPPGSLYGFLGPNGSGKTTLIRILLGLLRATRGQACIAGRDAWRDGAVLRSEIGYLPGDVRFYDRMTGRALLAFLDAARGGRGRVEIPRLIDKFALDVDKRIRRYSRGMKQKLGLIQALMHRPRLLVLDEPTTGLDPLMQQALFDELRGVVADGRTVLFSSHTLSEVEELCDHVGIVRDGNLIEQDTIAALRARAVRHVEVQFDGGDPAGEFPEGLRVAHRCDGRLSATWVGPPDRLLRWLASCQVRDVSIAPPCLEDLFLAYYADAPATVSR